MNSFTHVPPGFRFHPTDEELVDYYLRKKVASKRIDLDVIRDVDLYKIEPWDLQELCKIGSDQEVDEWYFFSHKDKKYPTGTRTNRATKAGFWKATGRDKAIYAKHSLIGMRKTLVFYKGRAPNGMKSDWIMHEYRLETNENAITTQEEGWVVCRVFKKRMPVMQKAYQSPCYFDNQVSFMPELDSPKQIFSQTTLLPNYRHHQYSCKQEVELHFNHHEANNFLQLPQLESPNNAIVPYLYGTSNTSNEHESPFPSSSTLTQQGPNEQAVLIDDQVTDWRVLDKFVASQLSHDNAVLKNNYSNSGVSSSDTKKNHEVASQEFPSMSSSSCPIELWK